MKRRGTLNLDKAADQLRATLARGRTDNKPPKHGVTLAPILRDLHDTDFKRQAHEYHAALMRICADDQAAEDFALWLYMLPGDLADEPWEVIARLLFYRLLNTAPDDAVLTE